MYSNILTLTINCLDTNKNVQAALGNKKIQNQLLDILNENNSNNKRTLAYLIISHLWYLLKILLKS